jgi:hypothetical protein
MQKSTLSKNALVSNKSGTSHLPWVEAMSFYPEAWPYHLVCITTGTCKHYCEDFVHVIQYQKVPLSKIS